MGKVKGKHRLDKYYRLAKEQGYRSRASWKLAQLDTKFSFLRSAHGVLDLCAAPGGWMQVAVQRVPVGSLVLGIDLVPIAPIRGAVAMEQDITRPECRSKIKQVMEKHGARAFDLVLHDGSPNVGGAWDQEAMSQNALVIDSVKLATEFLSPKGTFVTKVFRSRDYNSVLFCLKQLFEKVEVFKPPASRSASAETYLLGLKYKAPAKIDPRLLDVRHLFQGAIEPSRKVVDVLRVSKQKRHRDGYEDGESIVRKVASAADFIWSESPLEILGSVTTISFDDQASLPIKEHDLTTEEVKILCDDLPVLGKNDFKHLLKWRMQLRKALSPSRKESSKKDPDAEKEEEENDDDKLLNELEELTNATDRKKKREKKLLAKRRAKDKLRKATGAQIDALEDGYVDHELFSLSSIKGKKDLMAVDNNEDGNANDSENDGRREGTSEVSDSDIDTDEERQRYNEHMEEIFDEAYDRYMAKKEGSAKQRKRARQVYAEKLEDGDGDEEILSDNDSDKNEGNDEANPLMVPLDDGEAATQEEIANKWFSQDIFAEAVEEGDLGKDDSEDEMQVQKQNKNPSKADKSMEKKLKSSTSADQIQPKSTKNEDGFEIVPTPATDSSSDSSSDESDEEDVNSKAEILAYAKKMLRKKQREQMLDDAYNKYMFDDEGLPKWFLDDEKRHRQSIKPITKEEVAAMRAQFKEINARPAKKVAQAKARKKRAAMKRMEKVRKKANSISDQADISDRSKSKMIEQLYKKAEPKRPKKEYVVAKKGVGVKVGKGQVRVDRRMKKDSRSRGVGKAGKKGKKGGHGGGGKAQKGKGSAGKKGKRAA
ncbi:PREDICTED: putative rRNA methyltransferase [Tarenaya hassleriana]|uniref:putative rRNA methyltransferase n=1 Tax=Tarenaya hassleriana TaxID=28532 RepID=UPI00053C7B7A|nr:PREDICTED: putative rRNA methyltransferase [Tarenaya hassleriana]